MKTTEIDALESPPPRGSRQTQILQPNMLPNTGENTTQMQEAVTVLAAWSCLTPTLWIQNNVTAG